LILARHWLLLGAFACATVMAGPQTVPAQPPAAPGTVPVPATVPAQAPPSPNSAADAPDEGLIEFLGADDVGDADWWEFFKKAPPRGKDIPTTPPQDAKQ
jgi:hypothetical protein